MFLLCTIGYENAIWIKKGFDDKQPPQEVALWASMNELAINPFDTHAHKRGAGKVKR